MGVSLTSHVFFHARRAKHFVRQSLLCMTDVLREGIQKFVELMYIRDKVSVSVTASGVLNGYLSDGHRVGNF